MGYFEQSPDQLEEFLELLEEDAENVRRVLEAVEERDLDAEFIVHEKAGTVEESAENTDVKEGSIVKTLVFVAGEEPVAVMCPGDKRVSEQKLESFTGEDVRMAGPGEVENATGYTVGGVSPFDLEIPVYMEESILDREEVKPAAGSRVVGLVLEPGDLREAVDAEVADLAG